MKKRIKLKLHKRYLIDVVYEVSVSSFWREKLFKSEINKKYTIDRFHIEDFYKETKNVVINYNLRYYVSIIPQEEAYGWQDWDSSQVYFKFEAVRFPNIKDFSANNPKVI